MQQIPLNNNQEKEFLHATFLFLKEIEGKGCAVFTNRDIAADTLLETSPVLVLDKNARKLLEQTDLYDYIFEWGETREKCGVAWGYISLYNHSYTANSEHIMDFERQTISIKSIRDIKAGEELTINYNGDWNESKPVWFDAI